MLAKDAKKNKHSHRLVTRVILTVFAVYAVVSIIDIQVTLSQRRQELVELEARYNQKLVENKDIKRKIDDISNKDDLERIARENGYVAPDELVIIDISGR